MNSALEDEITSINSIYGENTLCLISQDPITCTLRLPSHPSIALRIVFESDYPDVPPSVIGTETVGEELPKGVGHEIADVVRQTLANIYQPGEACIYDLLEEAGEALNQSNIFKNGGTGEHATEPSSPPLHATELEDLGPEPPWVISDVITEKKSVFVARVARVSSPTQAKKYLRHLLSTDKKVAKATHNINAWRIKGTGESTYQDCDDDGETAAGGRLLHLMQLMDVWDVMVIVTRWYGGVHLGPDRFRIINQAARDGLVRAGQGNDTDGGTKKKGNKK